MPAFDVSLYLPELKQLKHLIERYKSLGSHLTLEANRAGRMRLSMETDAVNVVTHFRDLESPDVRLLDSSRNMTRASRVADDDDFASVRVDLKRFSLFLAAGEQLQPRKVLANVCGDRVVHVFAVHDDVCVQYFVPAVQA